jgi:hypothetical protein
MIFLAIFATDWLALYISLLTNAANAAFMWVSSESLDLLDTQVSQLAMHSTVCLRCVRTAPNPGSTSLCTCAPSHNTSFCCPAPTVPLSPSAGQHPAALH